MTLEITYKELKRQVGRFIGYGRDPDSYSDTDKTTDVDDCIRNGLRSFYFPSTGYRWSFLQPQSSLTLSSGTRTYDLPENFAGIVGTFRHANTSGHQQISVVDETTLRTLYSRSDVSGVPVYASVQVKHASPGARSVYETSFYPVPDATFALNYQYVVEPEMLDTDADKPFGGALHSQTILEACLAEAEAMLNPEKGPGLHMSRFQQYLEHSIVVDSQVLT